MEENNELIKLEEKLKAIEHKDNSLKRLDMSFGKHIELKEYKKSHLLAYWIADFSEYHDIERNFDYSKLKTFKRGDIVKANLGFNIGSELGGLHYCVVLNKYDNPYSKVLNVIPLTSKKDNKKYDSKACIDLGDEIYTLLNNKFEKDLKECEKELQTVKDLLTATPSSSQNERLNSLSMKLMYLGKIKEELQKMKHGSIAKIDQITTVSKIRIFNTKNNILLGITATDQTLDLIDSKIKKLYTK